ncbi:MAG: ABC transporter permease [Clostridiales Family XIII bacterium]|jgi:peptide/nickel transport system permease protein|nr:ABC transporter permease [Clostridiales Family XIII bacterium]
MNNAINKEIHSGVSGKLKKRSYFAEIWHRLVKSPVAVVCIVYLAVLLIGIIFADVIAPYDDKATDLSSRFQTPNAEHIMGTDDFGRDLFSRLLHGGRTSLIVAIIAVAIGIGAGMIIGAVCGYFSSLVDNILMRFMDVVMAIPGMLLAICVSVALGSGIVNTALAIAVGTIPMIARQLRSSTLLIRNQEYIDASLLFGASSVRIILHHVIPNTLAPIIVQSSLYIGGSIMAIAGLSFLGLGVQPPTPEWGNILNNGLDHIYDVATRWHVIVFPGMFIVVTMLAFNMLGDSLRDAMDPRMRK